ncbi:MAG TPA: hypothetical protein VFG66_08580 [Gemmatimonadales bacterium]|nr:hypothetical protein [Gemmatimonadales bacterium]
MPAAIASAEAQYPAAPRSPTQSTTSVVGQLPLNDSASAPPKTGVLRQLVCRGGEGVQITTQQYPSPRNPAQVAVSLSYRRNSRPAGSGYEQLEPGACSWNQLGDAGIPAEPGIVHFDLARQGAEEIPDPATLPVYLGDSRHYWVFYVDDVTQISGSHSAYGGRFRVDSTLTRPRKASATALRRERLRCRGGAGLAFHRGSREGQNLFGMTLRYQVASTAAGPVGTGLQPGTCAWADRTDARAEPGRIRFTTAGNAQLKQKQSGSAVDTSATAAERWPDVHTIPAYMTDPAHLWTFTVSLADPDSARQHHAWLPSIAEQIASQPPASASPTLEPEGPAGAKPPGGSGTSVSFPGASPGGERYTPGEGAPSFNPSALFDIKNVQVTSGLEGVAIRFEAAPNLAPTVMVYTAAPVGAAGDLRFDGQPVKLTVAGTATGGTHWRYSAASPTPLARGTRYWFIADAPEGPNSRANQTAGEFRTLTQRVRLNFSEITLISDGDSESDGDLVFTTVTCPRIFPAGFSYDLAGTYVTPVSWAEGRHPISVEFVSGETSVPDRFRLLIVGMEDDHDAGDRSNPAPTGRISCERSPDLEPGSNSTDEWNSIAIDFDLTRYPGASAGEQFIRRSKPLRNGSTLMFEVRGHVTVTRE